jgi:hypothetical protein
VKLRNLEVGRWGEVLNGRSSLGRRISGFTNFTGMEAGGYGFLAGIENDGAICAIVMAATRPVKNIRVRISVKDERFLGDRARGQEAAN